MGHKLSFQSFDPTQMVKVIGRSLPISTKTSVDVLRFIKGKKVSVAKRYLKQVEKGERAIPLRKSREIPHRVGKMGAGRFPKKASWQIVRLLNQAEAEAEAKGLSTDDLVIIHTAAHKGPTLWHYGRRRVKRKVTHIELVAKERKKEKKTEEKK